MDILKDTLANGELQAEKFSDHVAQTIGGQFAALLPVLMTHQLVIRISLEEK